MPRFYATAIGNRGEATRQGTVKSGASARVQGKKIGIHVKGFANQQDQDIFQISIQEELQMKPLLWVARDENGNWYCVDNAPEWIKA